MMRTVLWILLLVNVAFFAVMRWGGLLSGEPSSQVQSVLHADKVRLLPSVPSAFAASPVAAASTVAAKPDVKREGRVCMEWGEFSGAELERVATALSGLNLGERLVRREVDYSIGYWVYIPPLKSKAGIAQKLAQLKARGIEEYFVVQEQGVWLNAISLGVFKTREAAENFVNKLHASDVSSAQVGERNTKLKATVFVLNGLDGAVQARLAALRKDYPDSDQKEISCAH